MEIPAPVPGFGLSVPATTRNSGRAQPADILHRHVSALREATGEAIGQRLSLHP